MHEREGTSWSREYFTPRSVYGDRDLDDQQRRFNVTLVEQLPTLLSDVFERRTEARRVRPAV